jgi:hypothetical protein
MTYQIIVSVTAIYATVFITQGQTTSTRDGEMQNTLSD